MTRTVVTATVAAIMANVCVADVQLEISTIKKMGQHSLANELINIFLNWGWSCAGNAALEMTPSNQASSLQLNELKTTNWWRNDPGLNPFKAGYAIIFFANTAQNVKVGGTLRKIATLIFLFWCLNFCRRMGLTKSGEIPLSRNRFVPSKVTELSVVRAKKPKRNLPPIKAVN